MVLAFKPSFKAKTSAKTSKANGASLETTLNIGSGQTNFKSVMVQLPKQLPSRLTTLQKACPEAVFNNEPYNCPSGSFVGGARANTPTLPGKLQGPAILVSHGGAAFPDLDLVMEANGVRVIVVGNTKITKGITTTTFALDARRAGLEHHRQPADRRPLRADGERQPLHQPADDADDDDRAERVQSHAEDQHRGRRLPACGSPARRWLETRRT